ncbi:MAG TPA: hypothetical protein PK861_03785 [Thermomonas sp.]|nr:hypothetical protein [Thermomonas sp.]
MKQRPWLARHALGLWLLGIASLGFVRWWMKIGRDGGSVHAPDAMLWLAGAIAMAAIGLLALWRGR